MRTKYFLIKCMMLTIVVNLGCSKDEEPDVNSGCLNKPWGEQTKREADAVTNTATTFATSPSKATCESFRGAYIEYLEALEKLEPCVLIEHREAFSEALKNGKAELQNLNCNQDFDN